MTNLRNRKATSIVASILALLLTMIMSSVPSDVYAAGQITVNLARIEGLGEDFPGFTFDLYEVGGYDGGDFKLYNDYSDVNVKISKDDPDWEKAWLESANTLANHIKHPAEGESTTRVKQYTNVMPGDSMTYSSDKNALFLLVGNTVRYENRNYTPVPIFVRTLNGEETYTIDAETKIRIEPVLFEHSLMKIWDDNDDKDGIRPTAIEVGIYYGSQLIDRVVLGGESGEWTYTWESEEAGDTFCYIGNKDGEEFRKDFTPGDGDNAWGVREFTSADQIKDSEAKAESKYLKYYTPAYAKKSGDSFEVFVINNPQTDVPPGPPRKVKTGDESHIAMWIGITAIAAALLIAAVVRRRKNDR
jgi:LPXTG-motif cell wall-anchored protein